MNPGIFLFSLLSTVGIIAFTVVKVARLFASRRGIPADVAERLEELEGTVEDLRQELAQTQERVDYAVRMLSTVREEKRIGP
jgi:hypothetical protein